LSRGRLAAALLIAGLLAPAASPARAVEAPAAPADPAAAPESPSTPPVDAAEGVGEGAAPADPALPPAVAEAARPASGPLPSHVEILERVWNAPGTPLAERVARTRAQMVQLGLPSLEPAARALLVARDPGDAVARARAAVELAPDLPAARTALAAALLAHGDLLGAGAAALGALAALPRHLDARLWMEATLLEVAVLALLAGSALYLLVAASLVVPRAAHDLGDLVLRRAAPSVPACARGALLATVLLLPAVLGEGPFGCVLGLFTVVFLYGEGGSRAAAAAAALLVVAALHPAEDRARHAFAAVAADPLVPALDAAQRSVPSPLDLVRLERAAGADPLAAESLALRAKRDGRLVEADAALRALAADSRDARLLANAANARLLVGELDSAIELYERALELEESPVLLFNLSQAYARAIRLSEHEAVLTRAQDLDAAAVDALLASQDARGPLVADEPVPTGVLHRRLHQRAGETGTLSPLRAALAPGFLGGDPLRSVAALGLLAGVALALSGVFRASRACDRCGARLCPRCDRRGGAQGLCEACTRLHHRPETTDPQLRFERLAALRARGRREARLHFALALVVPGSAGLLGGRPARALAATLLVCGAGASVAACFELLPDPFAVGGAGALLLSALAAACAVLYGALLVAALPRVAEE
jgi:tetratricopeptide (TPR) repeat protein